MINWQTVIASVFLSILFSSAIVFMYMNLWFRAMTLMDNSFMESIKREMTGTKS